MSAQKLILIFLLILSLTKTEYIDFLINTKCFNKASEKGFCKLYKDCPHLLKKLKSNEIEREDIVDCNQQGIICCTPEDSNTFASNSGGTNVGHHFAPHDINSERISEKKCREYSASTKTTVKVAPTLSNPRPSEFDNENCMHKSQQLVVGGKQALRYEFPHQALIGYNYGVGHKWVCGGSIISPNFILTAAHCKLHVVEEYGKPKLYSMTSVKIGMISLTKEDGDTKIYRIDKFINHTNFESLTKKSDIALVELTRSIIFNEKIHPICLPSKDYGSIRALVTGFGRTNESPDMSEALMKATLEMYNYTYCDDYWPGMIDSSTMICFGNSYSPNVVDSCNGDSGGPLQIDHDNVSCSYIQIGIVSFGNKDCGTRGSPGVYVNVFHFIDWIEKIVWPNQ